MYARMAPCATPSGNPDNALPLFRALAAVRPEAITALEDAFDRETEQGQRMEKHDAMLAAALRNIARSFRDAELTGLSRDRGAVITEKLPEPEPLGKFDLITWLVITRNQERKRND